jgi:hypothetical protein
MMLLKACRRCRGDLMGGLDGELSCIQCGYEMKPEERREVLLRMRMEQRPRPAAAVR